MEESSQNSLRVSVHQSDDQFSIFYFKGIAPDSKYNTFNTFTGNSLELEQSIFLENSMFQIPRVFLVRGVLNYFKIFNSSFTNGGVSEDLMSVIVEDDF